MKSDPWEMTGMPTRETDELISGLAREAGREGRACGLSFKTVFAATVVAGLALAAGMVLALIGLRPDFAAAVHLAPFHYKLACTLSLALGAGLLAYRLALPGSGKLPFAALLPGLFLLAFRAATDRSGLSYLGNSDVSASACVLAILLVSVLPLGLLLTALRGAAPTRPTLAGAVAGLLAGCLGAAGYALACRNDAGLFVAIWYPAAILVMTGLGAVIGRRALAW